MIDWRVFLCVVGVFLAGAFLTKKVSFGSICGALTIFISAAALGVSTPRLILAAAGMQARKAVGDETQRRVLKRTENGDIVKPILGESRKCSRIKTEGIKLL